MNACITKPRLAIRDLVGVLHRHLDQELELPRRKRTRSLVRLLADALDERLVVVDALADLLGRLPLLHLSEKAEHELELREIRRRLRAIGDLLQELGVELGQHLVHRLALLLDLVEFGLHFRRVADAEERVQLLHQPIADENASFERGWRCWDSFRLGMGGVTTALDVRRMLEAGADSVGIGSALSRLEMRDYENYFAALKSGADVTPYLISGNRLQYQKRTVLKARTVSGDMRELTLSGEMNCYPGQFAFLWVPQVGEKPFSVAGNDPLKFLIRKRGFFSEYCFSLKEGDTVYTRGLYGKPMHIEPSEKALLLAGGSGVAVLPLIAEQLEKLKIPMKMKVGVPVKHETEALEDVLSAYGEIRYVADDGKPGRVLNTITADDVSGDVRVYIVGPGPMMKAAAERLLALGMSEERIHVSMERLTLCGVGLCGECVCAGRLACKEGTFYTLSELQNGGEMP